MTIFNYASRAFATGNELIKANSIKNNVKLYGSLAARAIA